MLRNKPFRFNFDHLRFETILRQLLPKKPPPKVEFSYAATGAPASFQILHNRIIIRHMDMRLLAKERRMVLESINQDLLHELGHWVAINHRIPGTGYYSAILGALLSLGALLAKLVFSIDLVMVGLLGQIYVWLSGFCLVYTLMQGGEVRAIAFQTQMEASPMRDEIMTCLIVEE